MLIWLPAIKLFLINPKLNKIKQQRNKKLWIWSFVKSEFFLQPANKIRNRLCIYSYLLDNTAFADINDILLKSGLSPSEKFIKFVEVLQIFFDWDIWKIKICTVISLGLYLCIMKLLIISFSDNDIGRGILFMTAFSFYDIF